MTGLNQDRKHAHSCDRHAGLGSSQVGVSVYFHVRATACRVRVLKFEVQGLLANKDIWLVVGACDHPRGGACPYLRVIPVPTSF